MARSPPRRLAGGPAGSSLRNEPGQQGLHVIPAIHSSFRACEIARPTRQDIIAANPVLERFPIKWGLTSSGGRLAAVGGGIQRLIEISDNILGGFKTDR